MKKKSSVYHTIIITWLLLSIAGVYSFIENIKSIYTEINIFLLILLTLNILFILYFWLSGTKDIVYILFYYLKKNKIKKKENDLLQQELTDSFQNAKILLLYCTCDDFNSDSLLKSMEQNYHNFNTFILDDSKDDYYKEKIDLFAQENTVSVVRRKDKSGFKAGNLNNFLYTQPKDSYDFFVVLDSDEIIPSNFIKDALHYFSYYPEAGILQATHISTRNRTNFMDRFSVGVDAHWPTYQSIKEQYGFLSFLGHGAMISSSCFNDVGGFPLLVAEDISFTLEAKFKGYMTCFSNEIVCEEEYPVDYYAFKKRHLKWTGGNLEFIQTYTSQILKSKKLHWFEKIDVVLFTYSLPLSSVFFIFLSLNLILLPWLGYSAGYPLWLMTPTTIYLLSPMINDMIFLAKKLKPFQYIRYMLSSFLLYGSLYWLSLYGATKVWLGIKPKFIVTPKTEQKYSVGEIIIGNIQEIIFSFILISISLIFTHSFLPIVLIVIPSLSTIYLTLLYKKNT